jgi:hypothetical protein
MRYLVVLCRLVTIGSTDAVISDAASYYYNLDSMLSGCSDLVYLRH